jgi:drug/metabolite transporter (DMT)-like permease
LANRILTTSAGTNREAFAPLDWALFLGISGIWGSSFLLIAIGLDAFEPGLITWLRVGLGALVLALVPRARRPIDAEDRPRLLALSVLWVGIPFTLFPIAQQHVNSAVAGMLSRRSWPRCCCAGCRGAPSWSGWWWVSPAWR